jgi:CubicO group peptidase (beta-lactamase class C family)
MRRSVVIAAWLACAACATARVPTLPAADLELDRLLESLRAESGVPGLAAAITDREGLVAIGASGLRRADEPAMITIADRFHLGSDTKAMTATLVARMVEHGVLHYEDALPALFPEAADAMSPSIRKITLEQLLLHRAGLTAEITHHLEYFEGVDIRAPLPQQRRIFIQNMTREPPESPPGSAFVYSNTGYVVVGAALESRTQKGWEELIAEELWKPLGMGSCGFGPPARGKERGQPFGHDRIGRHYVPTDDDNPALFGPAGTVHCSLADWAAFARAHLTRDRDLLSEESWLRLHRAVPTGQDGGYAMGWGVVERPWAKGVALTHGGSNTHNFASIWIAPELGLAFLVVANAGDSRAAGLVDQTVGALVEKFAKLQRRGT